MVRVIDDEDWLEILCKRVNMTWFQSKTELCGEVKTIDKLLSSESGYKIGGWSIPYNACILVKV